MSDLAGIYLLVTSPNNSVSPSPAQPTSNVTGYYHEAQEGEDMDAVLARVAGQYGMGCQLVAFDAQYAIKRRLTVTLQEDEG